MTAIKILKFVHLLTYLLLASQLMYYVMVMGDAMKMTSIGNFIEQRKIVDPLVQQRHAPVYYAGLFLSVVMLIVMFRQWNSAAYLAAALATVLLVADVFLAMRFNMPINNRINAAGADVQGAEWEILRTDWIYYVKLRGVIMMCGFVALLSSLVFTRQP